jgi:hypothetical protein
MKGMLASVQGPDCAADFGPASAATAEVQLIH